jgi:selenocysteine lyase/cysteine desulfurase
MTLGIDRIRRDTPGCADRIHFNNAGAALRPQQVTDAMVEYLRLEDAIGGYEAAARRPDALERPYHAAAELIGAERDEIALADSATRAWQMALYSLPLRPGDRILTSSAEYPGNYVGLLHRARQTGAAVDIVPDDRSGVISVDALRAAIDDRVKLIALTHVPTNNGLVAPAEAVGRIARAASIPYLLDAAQSTGQIPLDVDTIGCDMLVATGRKYLRGPRGAAFLYVRRNLIPRLEPPLLDWAAASLASADRFELMNDARRFETWEASLAARVGFGVALDYALEIGIGPIHERVSTLAENLRAGLAGIDGITVRDAGTQQCGIVTFSHESVPPDRLCAALSERNINAYPRGVTPLDKIAGRTQPVVRASVHYYNTEDEVDRFCAAISEIRGRSVP